MSKPIIDHAKASWGRRLWRLGLLLLLIEVLVGAVVVGFQVRRWTFEQTQPARFLGDINRNYTFGRQAMEEGFFNVYENQVASNPDEAHKINYTPLRLWIFEQWAKWNQSRFDKPEDWRPTHEFHAFVMYFNTALELLAAIAAFLIVKHWLWRSAPLKDTDGLPWLDRLFYGSFRATLAFLLLWFNPAMIANAHGWPTWDMWVIPFFLWAVLLASWEWWFLAGLVIGVGAMFKGQQMFVVWMFMLWPLFAGKPGRALRCLCGFGLAFSLVVSGWMLTLRPEMPSPGRAWNTAAIVWVACCILAVVLANLWRLIPSQRKWMWLAIGLPVLLLVAYPLWTHQTALGYGLLAMAGAIVAAGRFLPLRKQGYPLAGAVAASLFLCIAFFGATTAWWELGFMYGTERHMQMVVGPGNNLCALLEARFGFHDPKEYLFTIPAHYLMGLPWSEVDVDLRHLLAGIFFTLFVISCIAIAKQWRNNDRRFLVAIIVPWLLFYAIPAQVHERYLLYACGAGSIVIGMGYGYALLNVFLAVLTAIQTLNCMMLANGLQYRDDHPLLNRSFGQFCDRLRPDISWAVLAITGVFFFSAFMTSRWRNGVAGSQPQPAAPSAPPPTEPKSTAA